MTQVEALAISGNGVPATTEEVLSIEELEGLMADRNQELLQELRTDEHAKDLLDACHLDAQEGRMSVPEELDFAAMARVHFSPRFGVEQGTSCLAAPTLVLDDIVLPYPLKVSVPMAQSKCVRLMT